MTAGASRRGSAAPGSEKDRASRTIARYAIWRILGAILVLLLVLTLLFVAWQFSPLGLLSITNPRGCSPGSSGSWSCASYQQLIQEWGLDQSLLPRYGLFLRNVLSGNLGISISIRPGVAVGTIIASALPVTFGFVAVLTLALALLSVPIGRRLGRRRGGPLDTSVSLLLAIPFAVPVAMLGMLALYALVVAVPVFPAPGSALAAGSPAPLTADVLPGLVLLLGTLGLFTWVVRDHPLRPKAALVPPPGEGQGPGRAWPTGVLEAVPRFLAAVPILLPWTLAADLVIEWIFNLNGLGRLLFLAGLSLDTFVFLGIVVFAALVVLPFLVLADILHYAMTARWARADGVWAEDFRVDPVDVVRGFRKIAWSVLGLVGLVVSVGVVLFLVAGPALVGPYPTALSTAQPNLPPSGSHVLGTDARGFDVLTLLAYGGQATILAALVGFTTALFAGLAAVTLIGLFGERAAAFLVVPIDLGLVLSIPFLLFVVEFPSTMALGAIAFLGWPIATRLLLLETTGILPRSREASQPPLSLRERGERTLNLVWGTGPLVLADALLAASLAVSTVNLLGLGPSTGDMTWGQMVYLAFDSLAISRGLWWEYAPPVVCIALAVLGPTLVSLRIKQLGLCSRRGEPRHAVPPATTSLPTTREGVGACPDLPSPAKDL